MSNTTLNPLAVFEQGNGQKYVVMLHGMISTHRYWNAVTNLLDLDTYKIISPDLLGFGGSPKPKTDAYSLEQQVKGIDSAIKPLAKSPYILVGHSMGAIIALQWAVDQPELFSRVILSSMPLLVDETKYRQLSTIVESRVFKKERIARLGVHGLRWVNVLPAKLMTVQKKWPKHIAEDWTKHSRYAYKSILKNAVLKDQVMHLLQIVTVPVHILVGSGDGMIGPAGVELLQQQTRLNKNVTLEVVKSGHNLPIEHPEVVAQAILRV